MKKIALLLMLVLVIPANLYADNPHVDESILETYVESFDYPDRKIMKASTEYLVQGLIDGTVQLVDIRFEEERDAWQMNFGDHIPLPDLPGRLNELDPNKVIVTACPHKDRAILARTYLVSIGFDPAMVKYYKDGFVELVEYLRGDTAKNFVLDMQQ